MAVYGQNLGMHYCMQRQVARSEFCRNVASTLRGASPLKPRAPLSRNFSCKLHAAVSNSSPSSGTSGSATWTEMSD